MNNSESEIACTSFTAATEDGDRLFARNGSNSSSHRAVNTARSLYGMQLVIPKLTAKDIQEVLRPTLNYYPQRDRGIIADRVEACILSRQKKL